jgi:hypothetical protein
MCYQLAGNNRLVELREVQRLRGLPKLIILDLSGNPCTAAPTDDYRLYVIFNVRKLKVRDALLSIGTGAPTHTFKYCIKAFEIIEVRVLAWWAVGQHTQMQVQ